MAQTAPLKFATSRCWKHHAHAAAPARPPWWIARI